jgi:hypothetical protein
MYDGKYWSVEQCRWVDCPGSDDGVRAEVAVPQQREDEPVQEPVEA